MGGWSRLFFLIVFLVLVSGCVKEKKEVPELYECPNGQLVSKGSDCPRQSTSTTTVESTTMTSTTTRLCNPVECARENGVCIDDLCIHTTSTLKKTETVKASTTTLDYPKSIVLYMEKDAWHYYLGFKIKLLNVGYWDKDGKIAPDKVYFNLLPPDGKNLTKIIKTSEAMTVKTARIEIVDVIGVRYKETVKVNFSVVEPTTTTFIPGNTSLCPNGINEIDDHRLCPGIIIHE